VSSGLIPHHQIHTREKPSMEERPFVCQQCSESFSQSADLDRHLQTHTETQIDTHPKL